MFVRLITLSVVSTIIAFVLLELWILSAQLPWSSDDWLRAFPFAIVVIGFVAITALGAIVSFRQRNRRK
jgi:hypothetical protein